MFFVNLNVNITILSTIYSIEFQKGTKHVNLVIKVSKKIDTKYGIPDNFIFVKKEVE